MTPAKSIAAAMGLSVILSATPVLAGHQVYIYSVVHPLYGEIGTLTDTVDRSSEVLRIESLLRIAVGLLGVVVYRHESDTTEIMRNGRLISLQSVIEKDGQHLEVHGEAQGDQFVVNATAGSYTGPATTAPCDPWVLKHTGEGAVVYPSTGKITNAHVSGGDYETISVNGALVPTRHFAVMGDNREDVWLDNRGIPVMFRTVEDGTPIDFVLQEGGVSGGAALVASPKRSVPPRSGNASK
jgi:Family of unknown function (DUF6134)